MALRRTLAHRLFNITKISSPSQNLTLTHSSISSAASFQPPVPPDPSRNHVNLLSPENGFFRRFIQNRPASFEFLSMPIGDKLFEKLKGLNPNKDRIRLDGLVSPLPPPPPVPARVRDEILEGISVNEAKKLLKSAQLERMKSKLRNYAKSTVSYSEFVQICNEDCDDGTEMANKLDESGAVIVLRDLVFLRPEQVTKLIEVIIPLSKVEPSDPRRKELENMEKEKAVIDKEAEELVRKELWAGLGFLVLQTAGFMRLTFWELSWDIMEPVCFFVTSVYFMAGYAFFLRTSKDPSFEGFFESRFNAKQKRLIKARKFDVERFNELRRACYPYESEQSMSSASFAHSERSLMCATHP